MNRIIGALFALALALALACAPAVAQVGLPFPGPGGAGHAGGALACSYTPVTTGTQSTAYTGGTPSAAGGAPSYTFSETGTLPGGLSISSSTGIISGTPSASGTFTGIQVKVTDSASSVTNCGSSFTLVISASSGKTYARGGSYFDATGSATNTFSSAVGTATSTRVILIATYAGTATDLTSVSINGVSATKIASFGSTNNWSSFWSVVGSSPGSGTQTVSLVAPSGFFVEAAQVWSMDGLSSNTAVGSGAGPGSNPSTVNLNVAIGDFVFGSVTSGAVGTFSFSSSTGNTPANATTIASGPTTTGQGGFGNVDWTATTASATWGVTASYVAGMNLEGINFR